MVRAAVSKYRESRMGRYLAGSVPRYQVLPLYLIIVMFAWAGLRWNDNLARSRLAEASEEIRENVYINCVANVTSENNLRETLLAIAGLFPESPSAHAIRELIEADHPLLRLEDCTIILEENLPR